jgi:hypothetical protein
MSEAGIIILFLAAFIAPFTALFVVLGGYWLGIQMHWWK